MSDSENELDFTSALAPARKTQQSNDPSFIKLEGSTKAKAKNANRNSFASLGISSSLLRCLTLRGFSLPTPIQRQSIPLILDTPPRDVVAMARTGSGKTLAYMIPLLQRLGGIHSATFGARALILVPTRELALQVLKVGKDLARGTKDSAKQALRWALIVGGEGIDAQFSLLADNPDVIIATPGRLLHLAVEMNLDLRSVDYVVFDEADRLFELGFSVQLHEILARLPSTRQTLLFSATLPKTCVDFAKAGLQNPQLVRLDAESKISADLQMSFLTVKQADKEAALLCLLRDVIKVPTHLDKTAVDRPNKKRNRNGSARELAPHQTLIFAATKHHVEYLTMFLQDAGYKVSQIYSSLDQLNRQMQLDNFCKSVTDLLVVTDLAARGIDIPLLANVVNYDFPVGPKSFIHRVGRTARAGQTGWAHSFVTSNDLPYLFELQLFLARPLRPCPLDNTPDASDFANALVIGQFPQDMLDNEIEHVRSALFSNAPSLEALQATAIKGQRMYEKSSAKPSPESFRRAKEFSKSSQGLAGANGDIAAVHPIFVNANKSSEASRSILMDKIKAFRPNETVFEVGQKGSNPNATLMRDRRQVILKKEAKAALALKAATGMSSEEESDADAPHVYSEKSKKYAEDSYRLGYVQEGAATEKGYKITEDSGFSAQAAQHAFGLNDDQDGQQIYAQKASTLRWDRKNKRIVKGDGVGADNKKLIKTESGTRLPASFKSGKFDEWKQKHRQSLPRVGDAEQKSSFGGQRQYRHKAGISKPDKEAEASNAKGKPFKKRSSTSQAAVKGRKQPAGGLRNMDQITKERKLKAGRVRRSNQPSLKNKKGKGKR